VASETTSTQLAIRRPVLRYHGGKFRLAPKLIEIFPPHRVYTEAFGGGGSVLMRKPRSYAEIYNDLDGEVVNVFRVLQNRRKAKRLEELLRLTPFAREEFLLSYKQARSDVERARRTIVRSFMGFGSDSISRMKASRAGFNTRLSSTMSTGFRWNANRRGATPASERRIGNGTTPEHRYRHELATEEGHAELARVLHSLKGMVIVSSYRSPLYERLYPGWATFDWTGKQFCSSADSERTETVWLNEAAASAVPQRRFFEFNQ